MPENTDIYQERLTNLRTAIEQVECDGYIIPRTDEFQGEFLAPYAERLAWLTGFTGSAGAAIVTKDKAAVLSDGRYTIQLEQQVPEIYERVDITKTNIAEWLNTNTNDEMVIAYDPWLLTPAQLSKIHEKNITLRAIEDNLIDQVWQDQPKRTVEEITIFPDEIAGKTSKEKRTELSEEMEGEAQLITAGDSICWLLNVRGADIDFSPLIHSYALLYKDNTVDWFLDHELDETLRKHLGVDVRIFKREEMAQRLMFKVIGRDPKTAPAWFNKFDVMDSPDPCEHPKSIKTEQEQCAIREAHIHDGVAMVKFLKWLDETTQPQTELSVEQKLETFRHENPDYLGGSFSTIAGFAGNGAIVHYRATEETNQKIAGDNLLLIDSGGQYRWGTTDITRTIAIGEPTQAMKTHYTAVLKAHIAVASARVKQGTIGKDVDAIARAPLKALGLDYAHGTGHGVGCYLCVHEVAANLSPREEKQLEAGMLISNEPGYYEEDNYGIRLENLVLVQHDKQTDELYFETVTYAPFDKRLIAMNELSDAEQAWLENYNKACFESVSPHLDETTYNWLQRVLS